MTDGSNSIGGPATSRRSLLQTSALVLGATGIAAAAWPFVDQMNPSRDVLVQRQELARIPAGSEVMIKWRDAPIIIRHRTVAEISEALRGDRSATRDPQRDAERTKPGHAEWVVLRAVCTHENGVVARNPLDDYGWQRPCCGSIYDASGRIRKGPGPRNLSVPAYEFVGSSSLRLA